MRFVRRLPTTRLLAMLAGVVVLVAGGAFAVSAALGGSAAPPPPRPLAAAVHDALTAPPVQGLTARISLTNRLLGSSSIEGHRNPLLEGGTGRLWLAPGRGLRIELQSDDGDVQLVASPRSFFVYDGAGNTAYRGSLPSSSGGARDHAERAPSLLDVRHWIGRLSRRVLIGGPTPGTTANRASYTVRLAPREGGGLLEALELSWDAGRGVPLRAAVYARGRSAPVLELKATDVSFGPIPASTFALSPPHGAKVIDLMPRSGSRDAGRVQRPVVGLAATERAVGLRLAAPGRLAGLGRTGVRPLGRGPDAGAALAYGRGPGTIVVLERRAGRLPTGLARLAERLPTVSIGGSRASELSTPLGTIVSFERRGIRFTVMGSVTRAVAEAAARSL